MATQPTKNQIVVLAALLHDIGKFAQRANAQRSDSLLKVLCPVYMGDYSHTHVLYTDYFIEHILPLPQELEDFRPELARLASAHHLPDKTNVQELSIRDADCRSSGLDHIEGQAEGNYLSARLESVFSSLSLRGKEEGRSVLRYPLAPIDDMKAVFPQETEEAKKSDYATLWNGFIADLKNLALGFGVAHYIHSVQSILEKWTWCIPSCTFGTRADIPLYDHSLTTAAIAQALFMYRMEKKKGERKSKEILLFGGELSGIQNYIFTCGSDADTGAAKLLRARSFEIQMLTRAISHTLLERTGLESVAQIMDAAGKFILLLPATESVLEELNSLQREVEEQLLQRYHGTLRISFAELVFPNEDFSREKFQGIFNRFSDALDENRLKPFSSLMQTGLRAMLDGKSSDYAEFGSCGVCGIQPATELDENGRALCHGCKTLISELGRRLPRARFAILSHADKGFPLLGTLKLLLLEDEPDPSVPAVEIISLQERGRFTSFPVAGYIPSVSEADLRQWKKEGRKIGEETRVGEAKSFSMLAQLSSVRDGEGWRCTPRLAACKGDVDNLGFLFSIGLGDNFSIARLATLSRMMTQFFSSWLVQLARQEYPSIYIVFAGGDDFFVLGPWRQTIAFAERIQLEFTRFVAGNPDITLSVGIPLAKRGLPLLSLKAAAEKLLEAAKEHKGKDAVSLFGVTCSWKIFRENMRTGRILEKFLLEGKMSYGFVRRLLGYARDCRAFKAGDISKGLYISSMQYDMYRNCTIESPEEKSWLQRLPYPEAGTGFPDAEMAVSYALYSTRCSQE